VLAPATPSESSLWDPDAPNGRAKVPPNTKIVRGTHDAFATNDDAHVICATLLPVGFHAWLAARSR